MRRLFDLRPDLPFQVPVIGEGGAAEIDPATCQGCGVCVAECPGKAIRLQHFTDTQVIAKVDALLYAAKIGRVSRRA